MRKIMEQSRLEEIKELIQSGFNLELIAFELDIPLEKIKELKEEIEKPRVNEKPKTNRESYYHYKMSEMKQRYRRLFFADVKDRSDSEKENKQPQMLSSKEMQIVQTTIETIKEKINSMTNLQRHQKRNIAEEILKELKKLFKYQLTIEQIEELNMLLNSEELQGLGVEITNKKHYSISHIKRELTRRLAEVINYRQSESKDISELEELQKKFIAFEIKGNEILVDGIRREISTKISRIQQQNAIDRLRNDIPKSIETVITDLVNGNIDMQKANETIEEEAKRRVDGKPKTRFSLTEEQERKQILIQIRTAIKEKADKYPIQNPKEAILSIQQLCGGELGFNISTVVRNLIARKEFETAKNICRRFSGDNVEAEIKTYIRILRDEIRNAEISAFVLAGIKQNQTPEKEAQYFELIKKGLEAGNVKLSSISLGKNSDGSRNITLADVWPEEIQR